MRTPLLAGLIAMALAIGCSKKNAPQGYAGLNGSWRLYEYSGGGSVVPIPIPITGNSVLVIDTIHLHYQRLSNGAVVGQGNYKDSTSGSGRFILFDDSYGIWDAVWVNQDILSLDHSYNITQGYYQHYKRVQ
jgi:hypothetical protein